MSKSLSSMLKSMGVRAIVMSGLWTAGPGAQAVEIAGSDWEILPTFGYSVTSGNTDTTHLNASIAVRNEREKWRHTGVLQSVYSTQGETAAAERYELGIKTDYKFSERSYFFGSFNYDDDRFSGYDYQSSAAVGYGRRVVNNPRIKLDLEAGPGMRQYKFKSTGEKEDESMLRLAGAIDWKISDHARLIQDLVSEVGEELTVSKTNIALRLRVTEKVSTTLRYTVRHQSEAPAGTKKTDMESNVALGYCF